jgi:hypothetical protein
MAKFRCKLSGNVFEFKNEYDILDMQKHEQYKEIEDGLQTKEEQDSKEKVKKPRKAKEAK